MTADDQTPPTTPLFDASALPADALLHDRRSGRDRRDGASPPPASILERRATKCRRRRIDPTTFEKQYTEDELEFMNAMQQFKVRTGKPYPSYGDVLLVASSLGYRQVVAVDDSASDEWVDPAWAVVNS